MLALAVIASGAMVTYGLLRVAAQLETLSMVIVGSAAAGDGEEGWGARIRLVSDQGETYLNN